MKKRKKLNRSSSKFVRTRRAKEEEENIEMETLRTQQTWIWEILVHTKRMLI